MNSDTGELYRFETAQSKVEKEQELLQKQQELIAISEKEYRQLSSFPEEERPKLLSDLRAKNHAKKRRARRKMEKESRRRNRR